MSSGRGKIYALNRHPAMLATSFVVLLAACQSTSLPAPKSMADYARDAEAFNASAFPCRNGVGGHDSPAPRAGIIRAVRLAMPAPDNAVADVLDSRCTERSTRFWFCAVAAPKLAGGLIGRRVYFYGRYHDGAIRLASRGAEAESDCHGLVNGDRDI